MSSSTKLEDFGVKIGGARKDLYNFKEFTDEERLKFVKRDAIWKKPDYEKLIEDGLDDGVAYYMDLVRKGVSSKPYSLTDENIENYINTVTSIRDLVMALKTPDDIDVFFHHSFLSKYLTCRSSYLSTIRTDAASAITTKTFKAAASSYKRCKRKAQESLFGVPKEKMASEKIRRTTSVVYVNGTTVSVTKGWHGSECLQQKCHLSTYYYHMDNVDILSDKITNGDFVILNIETRRIILADNGKAFKTREEAETILNGMIEEAKSVTEPKKKNGTERKTKFKSVCVQNIIRSGAPDYIARKKHAIEYVYAPDENGVFDMQFASGNNVNINGADYMKTFGFRGGEFGHWMNDKDRQDSMNFGYNALMDLASVLKIQPESISLGKSLAIAFGARGKGSASAHFEPLRNVINLTKMSGAGCLAHEWCHALDFYIGKLYDVTTGTLASDGVASFYERKKLPEPFVDLVNSLVRNTETGMQTNYYVASKEFGKKYAKTGHGYWESRCEMLARAFDCYIHDKLAEYGIRSDYLSAYSESFKIGDVKAYPVGKERELLNQKFDALFDYLRNEKICA